MIAFNNHVDKVRVMVGRSWLFDNHLFILQLFDGYTQSNKWIFEKKSYG